MNKHKTKITILLMMVISIFILAACSDRDPVDPQHFVEVMESKGFEIVDMTNDGDSADAVLVAISSDQDFQIGLFVFENDDLARVAFNALRNNVDQEARERSATRSNTETNIANYSRLTITSRGMYVHLYRAANTLMMVDWSDASYRNEIRNIMRNFEN